VKSAWTLDGGHQTFFNYDNFSSFLGGSINLEWESWTFRQMDKLCKSPIGINKTNKSNRTSRHCKIFCSSLIVELSFLETSKHKVKINIRLCCLTCNRYHTLLTLWHVGYLLCWHFKEETKEGKEYWARITKEGSVPQWTCAPHGLHAQSACKDVFKTKRFIL